MWAHIQYWIQHRPKTVLFFIFLLTVLVRLPQLTRPLSKHHELNTAAVLICLQTWDERGIAYYHGAPVQHFTGPYDVFNEAISPTPKFTRSGTYLSLGPGAYLLPYIIMQIMHMQPTEIFIRLYSLLLHLISAFVMFYFLKFFQKRYFLSSRNFAFNGSLLFLTVPTFLWFMGNSYSHESMVIPFYLLALLLGFKLFEENPDKTNTTYALFAAAVMLAIYTDWLGVFVAFIMFVKGVFIKGFKTRFRFLSITVIAVVITVAVIFWQYISLVGWQEYKNLFIWKMSERSLPALDPKNAFVNYAGYLAIGYGLTVLIAVATAINRAKQVRKYLWVLAGIPFLHYAVFIGFSGEHDYAVLKWCPFILLLAIIGLYSLKQQLRVPVITSVVVFSVIIYECVNPPFSKDLKGEKYSWMKNAGEVIKATAGQDEFIFTDMPGYYHQVGWYSKRDYLTVTNLIEAKERLQVQPGFKGVFYHFNQQHQIVGIQHFLK